MNDLQKVLEYIVVFAHLGQTRKGSGLPYVFHPIEVTKHLSEWGIKDQVTLKAALTHDVPEERQDIPYENLCQELTDLIGEEAFSIVKELTFIPDKNSSVPASKQKEIYMESFGKKSVQALVIKLADRYCNTLDFFKEGCTKDYSRKYWDKGKALFESFRNREQEVVDFYGADVCNKIKISLGAWNAVEFLD